MIVNVNGEAVEVFSGARAQDAIRKYCSEKGKKVSVENLEIRDAWGNRIAPDSPLKENSQITFK